MLGKISLASKQAKKKFKSKYNEGIIKKTKKKVHCSRSLYEKQYMVEPMFLAT